MASSHNKVSPLRFALQYSYISVLASVALLAYTYWDIVKLRYLSGFFEVGSSSQVSGELFAAGFKDNLTNGMSTTMPIAVTLVLASLVAYTLYNAYKFTVFDLDVNHNYVNAKKVHTMRIVSHYIAMYTASFVVPLLFWCLYFVSIFPTIAKLPLNYIFGASTLKFAAVTTASILGLVMVTHIGLVITRLTMKILKKT